MEGDKDRSRGVKIVFVFQSTPSVWRETPVVGDRKIPEIDFNPLPPCGGRQRRFVNHLDFSLFQSTPSVWRETRDGKSGSVDALFQSTPSVWRETASREAYGTKVLISIHSLRVEGDW